MFRLNIHQFKSTFATFNTFDRGSNTLLFSVDSVLDLADFHLLVLSHKLISFKLIVLIDPPKEGSAAHDGCK